MGVWKARAQGHKDRRTNLIIVMFPLLPLPPASIFFFHPLSLFFKILYPRLTRTCTPLSSSNKLPPPPHRNRNLMKSKSPVASHVCFMNIENCSSYVGWLGRGVVHSKRERVNFIWIHSGLIDRAVHNAVGRASRLKPPLVLIMILGIMSGPEERWCISLYTGLTYAPLVLNKPGKTGKIERSAWKVLDSP